MVYSSLRSMDQVLEGMRLAKDVKGRGRQCLLKKGEILTTDSIEWLRRIEVREIWVWDAGTHGAAGNASAEEVVRSIETRFQRVSHEPLMQDIKGALVQYRTDTIQCKG